MSADELKAQGNAAFQAKDWEKAIDLFSKAIEVAPENHVLYSNRSAAFAADGAYEKALSDANKVIEIKPDWPKGYSRKATAQAFMNDRDGAMDTYSDGLEKCPEDPTLKKGLNDLMSAGPAGGKNPMAALTQMFDSPDLWTRIAINPDTRHLAGDAQLKSDIDAIKKDPSQLMTKLQSNPNVMTVMSMMMGISGGNKDTDTSMPDAPKFEKADPIEVPEEEASDEEVAHDEEAEMKAKSLAEKDLGNAAYKKKDFATAIAHYDAAIEIDPENMSFYNNKSAVYFEQGEYEKCREMCNKAVEVGKAQRAEYSMIAKSFARIGNSYHKEKDYENAIMWLNKSLTEHRTRDTLNKLTAIEKELKAKKALELLNPEEGKRIKEEGNQMFKKSKFPEAIKLYTEALTRNPDDHTVYSNRAASYMKLGEFPHALKDCDKCIEMAPEFVKGHTRRGNCLLCMREHQRALASFETALELDKDNKEATDGITRTYRAMNEKLQGMGEEERSAEAMKDPEIQKIMGDPVMRTILDQMKEDPAAAQEHLKNPEVMSKIQKLINAGIIRVGR